jgi:DNA-binding FadR family transcriptional regulator
MEKPVRAPALTESARDYIKKYIFENNLKEGDPLPTEAWFAQELSIGRSSVREAVKALQSLGIIEIRRGQGLFVRAYNLDSVFENFSFGMRTDRKTLMEWLQIRTWLESAVIDDSIRLITPQIIREIEGILAEWDKRLGQNKPHADLDERFHRALYASLNNWTLMKFLGAFWSSYQNLEHVAPLAIAPSMAERRRTYEEHCRILQAIKEGQPQVAVHYLKAGFDTLTRRLEAAWKE